MNAIANLDTSQSMGAPATTLAGTPTSYGSQVGLCQSQPDIYSLAWMAGSWIGQADGDPVDEHWSTPAGGTMMGMFRWLKNGRVYYYELLVIEPTANGLVLRLKHFDSELNCWEDRRGMAVAYPLVSAGEGEAVFERGGSFRSTRFVYRLISDTELRVTADDRKGDETASSEFSYRRA